LDQFSAAAGNAAVPTAGRDFRLDHCREAFAMDWRPRFAVRQTRLHRRPPRPLAGPEALEGRALLAADLLSPQAAATEAAETTAVEGWQAALPAAEILPAALPNDPSFAFEWGLLNTGQYAGLPGNDIGATRAWDVTTGSRNVVVAVIDSGIDLAHPDLAANLWVNPGEVAGDGIDNDGNGFVDDVHGWDFVDNDGVPQDGFGHGTHVAGIIGAVGNNGTGVTGVNWQVSIMALRIQDDRGAGTTSRVLAALRYATMMRRDYGVMIVASNNSWEAPAGYSVVVEQAIREHGEAGITFVAAAGNNGTNTDLTPKYPGGYDLPNVITVASLTPQGVLASSSNHGATSVDVAAPGTVIQSTFKDGGYRILSGTSMAAPHVTGVAALLAAAKPDISVAEIRAAILGGATPVASLAGKVAGGRLNAWGALAALGVQPATPAPAVPAPVPPAAVPQTPVAPTPPAPTPVAVGPMLPFRDTFTVANGPVTSPDWTIRAGSAAISSGGLVSRSSAAALVTVRNLDVADVSLRSLVDVRRGGRVSLVARHDAATGQRVRADLFRVGRRIRGRIMVGSEGQWQVVAARWMPGGRGAVRLDVIGDRMQLFFNGRRMLAARSVQLPPVGGIGLEIAGLRSRAENFVALPAA
jgi:subtilisin family serine protease